MKFQIRCVKSQARFAYRLSQFLFGFLSFKSHPGIFKAVVPFMSSLPTVLFQACVYQD